MNLAGQSATSTPIDQRDARRSGRGGLVIVTANPDAAHSPRGGYPAPAVVAITVRGKDRSSDEKGPVMAMYEPSMTEERPAMQVACVPAAETAARHRQTATATPMTATPMTAAPMTATPMTTTPTTHVATTAHVAATCHGNRGQ